MSMIIVCTNFSKTSRNALEYACSLINARADKGTIDILLLHIFTIPPNYSSDGIAMTTINNCLNYAEEDLHEELEWVNEFFPHLHLLGKITTGRLVEGLEEQIQEMNASLVIIGSGGNYGDLWSWDKDILNALRDLSVPILTIPPDVTFAPLRNIAFACNLKNVDENTPFDALIKLTSFTGATLHLVYVANDEIKKESIEADNEEFVHNKLQKLHPKYYTLYENEVVGAIGRFVEKHDIQLLLVIPKKHGIWNSLFHKSYTKELSRLNRLPVMALH